MADLSLSCTINWTDYILTQISKPNVFTTHINFVIIKSNKCSFGGEW